jgi:hypothetical protein
VKSAQSGQLPILPLTWWSRVPTAGNASRREESCLHAGDALLMMMRRGSAAEEPEIAAATAQDWGYRAGMFHQDLGMRIDLVLAKGPVAERVHAAWVDRTARKGSGPSDHAAVIVDLDDAPGWGHRASRAAAVRTGRSAVVGQAGPSHSKYLIAPRAQYRGRSRSRDGCTRLGSPGIFG